MGAPWGWQPGKGKEAKKSIAGKRAAPDACGWMDAVPTAGDTVTSPGPWVKLVPALASPFPAPPGASAQPHVRCREGGGQVVLGEAESGGKKVLKPKETLTPGAGESAGGQGGCFGGAGAGTSAASVLRARIL